MLENRLQRALLIVLLTGTSVAQTIPTWTEQFPPYGPLPRSFAGIAYDATHEEVVLFGGLDSNSTPLGDTWVWNGKAWTEKFPRLSPPPRKSPLMAYDAAQGEVVLFGGTEFLPKGNVNANDTWVWNGSNWTEKFPAVSPAALESSAMVYDSTHHEIVLFGGSSSHTATCVTFVNQTWIWNGATWTEKYPATPPAARGGHGLAYDAARGQVVLFGGMPSQCLTDSFALPTVDNDTWVWNGTYWTQKFPANRPSMRQGPGMVYDSAESQIVLFGGDDGSGKLFGDTWVWNGENWIERFPAPTPSPRSFPAMVYDAAQAQILLFGGSDLGDTWTWGAPNSSARIIQRVASASGKSLK